VGGGCGGTEGLLLLRCEGADGGCEGKGKRRKTGSCENERERMCVQEQGPRVGKGAGPIDTLA
jgi:hypothetical protein